MIPGTVTTAGDPVLKWCFECGFYEWAMRREELFVCGRCNEPIRDWVSRLLYTQGSQVDTRGEKYSGHGIRPTALSMR